MTESIRESIDNAIKEVIPTDQTTVDVPSTSLTDTKPVYESTKEPVADAVSEKQANRDEKGRFTNKAAPEKAATEQVSSKPITAKTEVNQDAGGDPSSDASNNKPVTLTPPVSWRSDAKKIWNTIPEAARSEIVREHKNLLADYTKKSMMFADSQKYYGDIEQAIGPYRDTFRQAGMRDSEAIKALIEGQRLLDTNPVVAIKTMMETYGIGIEHLADAQPLRIDPAVQQLKQELDELKQERQQQTTAQQQALYNQTISQIEAFAMETDAQGNLLRPEFVDLAEEIEPIVARLKQAKPRESMEVILQEAYDRAVWANPQTRESRLNATKQETTTKQLESLKTQAEKAKRLGASLAGAPSGSVSNAKPTNVRDAIRAAWDQHMS